MTALLWQTAVLLLVAYFAGAWVACMIRRTAFAARAPHAQPSADAPVAAAAGAGAIAPAAPVRWPDPPPGTPRIEPVARTASAGAEPVARFERALSGETPAPEVVAAQPAGGGSTATASALAAAAVAAAAAAARSPAAQAPQPAPHEVRSVLPAAGGSSGANAVSAPIAPVPAPEPALPPDDLTRIRAIDDTLAGRLADRGVTHFGQIADWRPTDIRDVSKALSLDGRISRENWIEQAQILAKGGETHFSRRKERGELATAAPSEDEGETKPIAAAAPRPDSAGSAGMAAAVAAAGAAALAAAPDRAAIGLARDDLQRISGINAEVERLLNVQGVTRYSQIAGWSAADVGRFDRLLGPPGRIARENWIEQAQILGRGGETAASRRRDRDAGDGEVPQAAPLAAAEGAATADSGRPRADIAALRSVRSEAFRTSDTGQSTRPGRPAGVDDLKRIRGVGVLIEKKLNSMGIATYDQIANWTGSDIDRVSQVLDFKGRIERENWVEQARILSSGGQTEFSRRVDRGEVETSRRKGE
jgi:predicted flap endonuclease-1-like 5' DNA nuclease